MTDPATIAKGLTADEMRELRHRLSECAKASEFYRRKGGAGIRATDIIFLYDTVNLLGRAHLRNTEDDRC